jgi:hypothetical protein
VVIGFRSVADLRVVAGVYDAGFGDLAFWSDRMKAQTKPLKARLEHLQVVREKEKIKSVAGSGNTPNHLGTS